MRVGRRRAALLISLAIGVFLVCGCALPSFIESESERSAGGGEDTPDDQAFSLRLKMTGDTPTYFGFDIWHKVALSRAKGGGRIGGTLTESVDIPEPPDQGWALKGTQSVTINGDFGSDGSIDAPAYYELKLAGIDHEEGTLFECTITQAFKGRLVGRINSGGEFEGTLEGTSEMVQVFTKGSTMKEVTPGTHAWKVTGRTEAYIPPADE